MANLLVLSTGTQDQHVLGRTGDAVKIDWGYQYVATRALEDVSATIASALATRAAFVSVS